MENRNEIWVFAQLSHGLPMPVVSELIAKAQEISAEIEGSSVAAVVFGDDNEKALQELGALKIDKIYNLENPELASYRCDVYAAAMCNLVETYQPAYLFFGATAVGSELAPSVAALVKTGLAAHCIDLKWNGERLNCIVPAFGGKVDFSAPRAYLAMPPWGSRGRYQPQLAYNLRQGRDQPILEGVVGVGAALHLSLAVAGA